MYFFSYESMKSLFDKFNQVIDDILVSLSRYDLLLYFSIIDYIHVSPNRLQGEQPHG